MLWYVIEPGDTSASIHDHTRYFSHNLSSDILSIDNHYIFMLKSSGCLKSANGQDYDLDIHSSGGAWIAIEPPLCATGEFFRITMKC